VGGEEWDSKFREAPAVKMGGRGIVDVLSGVCLSEGAGGARLVVWYDCTVVAALQTFTLQRPGTVACEFFVLPHFCQLSP